MIKQKIKDRLKLALRQKFESYNPETSFMPFHTRLLGKDRMALYSFIQILARVFLNQLPKN
ncbi:TdeIII family type II restriction endonuclease [Campylobacter sp. MIT 12-5580]|uniref:TdeIII family type II restriction endonuclease n=1 Tax=Campylobacter sp. MIT 12-5580 TaxID=2040651 RepID=UPI001BB28955